LKSAVYLPDISLEVSHNLFPPTSPSFYDLNNKFATTNPTNI